MLSWNLRTEPVPAPAMPRSTGHLLETHPPLRPWESRAAATSLWREVIVTRREQRHSRVHRAVPWAAQPQSQAKKPLPLTLPQTHDPPCYSVPQSFPPKWASSINAGVSPVHALYFYFIFKKIYFFNVDRSKSLLNLSQYYFCFMFLWPWGMWDLCSWTRDWTCTLVLEGWSLNKWTVRKVSSILFGVGQSTCMATETAKWQLLKEMQIYLGWVGWGYMHPGPVE